jgi:hypothetical protein
VATAKYFGKRMNRPHQVAWKWVCARLGFNFNLGEYQFKGFEYDDSVYFVLELDFNFTGYGSYSSKETYTEYERSIIHFVIFRTKFGIRKKWRVTK